MGEPLNIITFETKTSDPLQFHSGHECELVCESPQLHPRSPFGIHGSQFHTERSLSEKKDRNDIKRKLSPKPKRQRKISLFSQFHFNGRSDSKSRKVSAPTISSLVPCSLGYTDEILPDFSSDSSNSSIQSFQSSSSLPVPLTIEHSSIFNRKPSTSNCVTASDNHTLKDIIMETLTLQFENVTEYKRDICDKLSKNVSELVRRRIEIMMEAHGQSCKVVTLVYVGAVRDKGIDIATQALLEIDKDLFTAASHRNGHVFAVAAAMVVTFDTF